jgi:hypothetical protein
MGWSLSIWLAVQSSAYLVRGSLPVRKGMFAIPPLSASIAVCLPGEDCRAGQRSTSVAGRRPGRWRRGKPSSSFDESLGTTTRLNGRWFSIHKLSAWLAYRMVAPYRR